MVKAQVSVHSIKGMDAFFIGWEMVFVLEAQAAAHCE